MKTKKLWSIILSLAMLASLIAVPTAVSAEKQEGEIINHYMISDKYYTGDYAGSVLTVTGTPSNGVDFKNVTFENITSDGNGACVYIDVDSRVNYNGWDRETVYPGDIIFSNCLFINCSSSIDGGAVYINNSTEKNSIIF